MYNDDGSMKEKRIRTSCGADRVVCYGEGENENNVVQFQIPAPTAEDPSAKRTVTSQSKTDAFGRKVFDELQLGTGFVSRQFSYYVGEETEAHTEHEKLKSSPVTHLVSRITLSGGRTLSYEYDEEERITQVTDSELGTTFYEYDRLGQLTKETFRDKDTGTDTVVSEMTYDGYGNIRTKNGVSYGYSNNRWPDLLTSYNGRPITYDFQGNPVAYRGHTMTWEKGRQLKAFHNSDSDTDFSYTYNASGIRTSKTGQNTRSVYLLDGSKILQEVRQELDECGLVVSHKTLTPLYDNEESVCGIEYDGETYFFQKNLQGDVIGIVSSASETVAKYTYDAWGKCTVDPSSSIIGTVNPYRYRGYYYDTETGLYYVSSRYYDPEIGRFLNSDDPMFLGATGNIASYNLFAYCENNPVNYKDPSGYGPFGTIIGGILGFGLGALLVPRVADLLKLKGWGRKVFIWAGVAALTGLGAYVGNYVGEAIFAAYKAGGAFAAQINKAIAKGISKLVGGTLKSASGNGWVINIKKIVVRVMTSSNYRNNYFKISVAGKAAYDILGNVSSDPAEIHIPITFNSIIKLVQLIFKLK